MTSGKSASVIICDDIRMEVTGKLIIVGAYTSDIAIVADEQASPQMAFLFAAECPVSEMFRNLKFQVTLPGASPVSLDVIMPDPAMPVPPGRTRFTMRGAVNIVPAVLRPGRIEAKVIYEGGEMLITAGWITKIAPPAPVPTAP